jgi:hypothetical protein
VKTETKWSDVSTDQKLKEERCQIPLEESEPLDTLAFRLLVCRTVVLRHPMWREVVMTAKEN